MPSQFKSNTMMVNQRSPSGSSSPVKGVTGGAALPLNSSSGASTLQTPAPTQYKPLTSLALKDGWALEGVHSRNYYRYPKLRL
jgi:hypothetical protein